MKNIILSILILFSLSTLGQVTVEINAKDKKDSEILKNLRKQEVPIKIDKKLILVEISNPIVKSKISEEDILTITPQLKEVLTKLTTYAKLEEDFKKIKTEFINKEKQYNLEKNKNKNLTKESSNKTNTINTLKKKNSVDESKIAKEKNYINSMIDICLSKGPDDTPKELRDMLIKSATNINSTKKIELIEYNKNAKIIESAKSLIALPYNKSEIDKNIKSLQAISTTNNIINKEVEKIKIKLLNYCNLNNQIIDELESQKNIPNKEIIENNITKSRIYRTVKLKGYKYLKKQAEGYWGTKTHSLIKINCK